MEFAWIGDTLEVRFAFVMVVGTETIASIMKNILKEEAGEDEADESEKN